MTVEARHQQGELWRWVLAVLIVAAVLAAVSAFNTLSRHKSPGGFDATRPAGQGAAQVASPPAAPARP